MSDLEGAINEKARNLITIGTQTKCPLSAASFCSNSKAHLLHALEGLDRYPNYLNRWNNERDIDELELALLNQLEKVREQRRQIQRKRAVVAELMESIDFPSILQPPDHWEQMESVLHPDFFKALTRSRHFRNHRPLFNQLLSGDASNSAVMLEAHVLEDLMEQEVYDVYSLPVLHPSFCKALRTWIQLLRTRGDVSLQMGTRPTDLDTIGLAWINNLLLNLVVRPISHHLFKETECGGNDLDWRQGYVAAYHATADSDAKQNRLVTHTDDSEVTLNVGLGEDFEGGLLMFSGLRREDGKQELLGQYQPMIGRAVIHAGRHFHQVTKVTKGNRYALIVWARSWSGIRKEKCACCWLNRRQGNSCVCGSRWN